MEGEEMNISSISSRNTNNSAIRTKNIDNQIKLLEKQKSNVQEQISKIKERKVAESVKAELIKPLQEQIKMLDQQIQQKQMEKMNKDEDNEGGKNTKGNSKTPKATEDCVKFSGSMDNLVKLDLTYSKIKIGRGIKAKVGGESRILKVEAKLDRDRGKIEIAEKKETKASEIDTRVSKLEKKMAKENAEVRKAVNKEDIKDTEKNKDENEINKEKYKNINVLA